MRAPSGRVLSCGIYRTSGPGPEVRIGFSDDGLLRSQQAAALGHAREIAENWHRAIIAKGGCIELPLTSKWPPMRPDSRRRLEAFIARVTQLESYSFFD